MGHANEDKMLEWRVKARPYIVVANGIFWCMMVVAPGACYLMFFKSARSPLFENLSWDALFIAVIFFASVCGLAVYVSRASEISSNTLVSSGNG